MADGQLVHADGKEYASCPGGAHEFAEAQYHWATQRVHEKPAGMR